MKPKPPFWKILIDDTNREFEILGTCKDDSSFTADVTQMLHSIIDHQIIVQCDTPTLTDYPTKESLYLYLQKQGYTYKEGLYQSLMTLSAHKKLPQ